MLLKYVSQNQSQPIHKCDQTGINLDLFKKRFY